MSVQNIPEQASSVDASAPPQDRSPYYPTMAEWPEVYGMLCGYCSNQTRCEIIEAMIDLKNDGPWPDGGWVSDPGAGVSCLSYAPKPAKPWSRQRMRAMKRSRESDLPPVCGGCAARRGSEASVSLHTRRDYAAAVRNRTPFDCHERSGEPCGGWCRAVLRRPFDGALASTHGPDDQSILNKKTLPKKREAVR